VLRIIGDRDDRDFNKDERAVLPSYSILDLSGELALSTFSPGLNPFVITARLENALDREYQPAFGFQATGRMILIGARAALGNRN
jgi:outer membrane cobalamin receptor